MSRLFTLQVERRKKTCVENTDYVTGDLCVRGICRTPFMCKLCYAVRTWAGRLAARVRRPVTKCTRELPMRLGVRMTPAQYAAMAGYAGLDKTAAGSAELGLVVDDPGDTRGAE